MHARMDVGGGAGGGYGGDVRDGQGHGQGQGHDADHGPGHQVGAQAQRRRVVDGLSVHEHAAITQDAAAWTIAARVLLNLDETLTKN